MRKTQVMVIVNREAEWNNGITAEQMAGHDVIDHLSTEDLIDDNEDLQVAIWLEDDDEDEWIMGYDGYVLFLKEIK